MAFRAPVRCQTVARRNSRRHARVGSRILGAKSPRFVPHSKTIPYYKQLKKKWKVSIAAMIRRAEKLGVMSMGEYQTLIKTMQRRGQRKEKPLDDILITAGPALLKTSVMILLQENVFTPKEFMEKLSRNYELSIDPVEVEYLLDLPVGTLSSSKIIDIASLQLKQR